ncbi:unnamed protein product [Adineta ricciae]|uniref:UMOD/GP2/OIT3-like D8C domain-containing protein n=1 Tax=Adineta ricciae TaxID=249248 RepID=A0A814CD09_ADIRI|nr:unnamed protein product [Adineta ricciae]CAF0941983.1 unnamed protein product [Adineta ricciae]
MSVSTINIQIDDNEQPTYTNFRKCPYTFDQDTTLSSLRKFNTRSCLITIFLLLAVVTLLALAGLIVAIYALTVNFNNHGIVFVTAATSSTTTVNTSVTTSPVQCSSTPITTFTYATDTPSQCSNYTLNTDKTRNLAYTSSITSCDNTSPFSNNTSVWIRFQDPAGTLIANSVVPPNSCGTVASGWFAGQYPTAFFSTATSIVCYYYSTNTCSDCNLISITNCKTFYVFLLPQPDSCNYRYCTV